MCTEGQPAAQNRLECSSQGRPLVVDKRSGFSDMDLYMEERTSVIRSWGEGKI
jgi:hypothetical protein